MATEWIDRVPRRGALLAVAFAVAGAACSSSRDRFEPPESRGAFGNDAGATPVEGGAACTAVSLGARHRPLDLFITLDRSGSMEGVPWNMAKRALEEFFANPPSNDVAAALNYFPLDGVQEDLCSRDLYRPFAVDIGPLPAHAPALAASLERTSPLGGTPTSIALDGALFTATAYKRLHPDHQVAVVLVSDGVPTECTNAAPLTELPKIALAEYGTLTFTIGIGNDTAVVMDALAGAGGTGRALRVSNASEIGLRLREAQVQAVACELVIPATTPDGRTISSDLVNVVITDSLGPRTIRQVDRFDTCGNREGWYYDDPKNPTSIRLCPSSCDLVKARKEATADVQFGCQTVGPH